MVSIVIKQLIIPPPFPPCVPSTHPPPSLPPPVHPLRALPPPLTSPLPAHSHPNDSFI